MLPGVNNIPSVGSKPTCRGGKAILNTSVSVAASPISAKEPDKARLDKSFDLRQSSAYMREFSKKKVGNSV